MPQQSDCVIQWFWLKVPPQIQLLTSHGVAVMALLQVFLCLDSSAEAITRGPSVLTKTLKAKQTDQCDNKRGNAAGWVAFVFVWCDRAHSSLLQSQLLSSFHAAFEQFIQGRGGENANLFHTAITSHHDIEPTLLQCPSALTVKMSDEFFSSEGNPIWFTLPLLPQQRRLFVQGHVSFEYQSLWGGGQTL